MPTVLVIDDDLLFREMILMALEEAAYNTLDAESGQEGIELAIQHQPSLIVCDVRMGGLDGYQVLAALREHAETSTIPFILMTGMADAEGMREGMNLGADDYLAKPFSVDTLLSTVSARLQKQEAVRQQAEQKLEALRASITLALPHELRTPLNGILTSAQLLRDDAEQMTPALVEEFAGMVLTNSRRLQRLIENFLIYAQLEMLARDPNQTASLRSEQTTHPHRCVEAAAQTLAGTYGRLPDLVLDLPGAAHRALPISSDYLGKIMSELLDNAFKFSNEGTAVTVSMTTLEDRVQIAIRDQGCGMDVERVADIGAYMQFERAVTEQQGTGLGLQIVNQLLELHGGVFQITSTPGVGTSVEVGLPIYIAAEAC